MSITQILEKDEVAPVHHNVKWWQGLQFSLLLYLTATIFITSLLLMWLVFGYVKPKLTESENMLHRQTSEAIVYQIQNMMQSAQVIAQSLSETVEHLPVSESDYRRILPSLLNNYGTRDKVAGGGLWPEPGQLLPDKERASLFWARAANGNLDFLDDYNNPINPAYQTKEWYVPTIYLKSKSCYWSRTYLDPYSKEPMVTCSVPVFRKGQLFGVSTVDLRLKGIKEMLENAAKSIKGYALILDRENRLLSIPEISNHGSMPASISQLLMSDNLVDSKQLVERLPGFLPFDEVAKRVNENYLRKHRGVTEKTDRLIDALAEKSPAINIQQAEIIATLIEQSQFGKLDYGSQSFSTLELEQDPFLNEPVVASIFSMPKTLWKVIIVSPQSEVFGEVNRLTKSVISLLSGLAIFILGVSYFAIRLRIIRPINQIIAQLTSDSTLPLDIDSHDEIGMVADHINFTTKELRLSNERMSVAVDKRERADKLRRLSEKRFKAIARTAPDAIISADSHGAIVDWNPAAESIFGYSKTEIIGASYQRLLAINEVHEKLEELKQYLNGQVNELSTNDVEIQAIRSTGELFAAELSCTAWRTERGKYFTIFLRDISERIKAQHALRHQALHDPLTELPNRNLFNDRLEQSLKHADRDKLMVGIMLLDLDNFKIINDTLGHKIGDELLISVTNRIQREQRASDTIARLGGDEFGVILSNIHSPNEAMYVAERFRGLICEPLELEENSIQVGVSIGITVYPDDADSPESLLRNADMAMYQAKEQGRNACCFFVKEMDAKIRYRKWIQEQIEVALREHQFDLYLQPLVDIKNNKIAGAEALIRWMHPDKGFISPVDFIPIAEHSGLINEISDWVLERACQYITRLKRSALPKFSIAINLSAAQFRQKNLIERMLDILMRNKVEASMIECEITETTAMENVDEVIETLEKLHACGFALAIDDFGTGYSSLSYLKKFPIGKIKIDRSFIVDIGHSEDSGSIASAVIEMGHSMNLKVLAEGVEEEQQVKWLTEAGCDLIQGYYYAKPMPIDEFSEWADSFLNVVD